MRRYTGNPDLVTVPAFRYLKSKPGGIAFRLAFAAI